MNGIGSDGLFGSLFGRGQAGTGDQAWLQAMLDTEAALARALERAGLAAPGSGAQVSAAARADRFDPAELGRQAARAGNPVPALARALAGMLPPGPAAAVHRGATSQDIIDTAAMLLASRVLAAAEQDLASAAAAAAALASGQAGTVMIGRTLLQQAVPVTFGLVAAGWLTAIDEARGGLARVARERLAVQFGGAAGTLASLGPDGPRVAGLLAAELGLAEPVLPWHTSRLRVIELAAALAGTCAALGKIARDVTLLAQSEVAEVSEGPVGESGAQGIRRGGSSTMPHKRNPVAAVVIVGCARQAPGLLATLTAAGEQELQRAAGGWHAEWQPLTALLGLTGSAASWAAELLGGLAPDPARMRANLDAARGLPLAERVAALLAPALGQAAAHDAVARAARAAADSGRPLRDELLGPDGPGPQLAASGIGPAELDAALDPAGYLGGCGRFVARALAAHQRYQRDGKMDEAGR
ncbi:MAG TPA: lyase family protein [Streptosporangiaceae bacterium]